MRAKLAGVWLFAAALALATWGPAQEKTPTAITDIRQESSDRSTRLVVECTGPLAYTYYSPDPLTLVVDIPEVDASQVPARVNVGTREVESLRVTSLARADGRNLARVEVRLASLVPYQIFSKDKTLNLVFERPTTLAAAEPAPAPPPASVAPPPVPVAAPASDGPRATTPEVATGAKASRIVAVTRDEVEGLLAFTVKADGRLKYRDFVIPSPDRLVVDFADVTARASVRALEVGQKPVRKVRLGQFSAESPKVARLVLDLTEPAPYRIIEGTDGVRIVFGDGTATPAAPAHPPLASLRPAEPEPAPVPVPEAPPVSAKPLPSVEPLPLPALPEPQVTSAPAEAAPDQGNIGQACGTTGNLGTPISLDFKDGDLQDIFRLFSDISGLNVVVNPGVTGKVTLKLNEVPWGRALELILKTNNLGCVLEDNVIRIAKLADLQREETDRRKLQEEKALAGDLVDFSQRISYAKAADLEAVLRKAGALSQRGTINVDTRTNTLLIRDLPGYLDKSKILIADLDTATPQVEIEARIVVTSRNFIRDLGIQWGFQGVRDAIAGNTTNLAFPNSIYVNGSPIQRVQGITPVEGVGNPISSTAGGRGYLVNLPASSANTGIGITMGNILGTFNLDVALTALESQGRGRILSTPKVTTQNNKLAEIKQGMQIPYQTTANNTVTVQFKDAVLTLKVTPQITDAGTVILDLEIENNSANFERSVAGVPPINTQSAKTQVLVKDGQTAVVGGIYQSTEFNQQDSTPFLGKIPVLGYLFQRNQRRTENNELLLFITPRIVKS
jgi:type IV pilus assembly protein PilQ